MKYLLDTNIIIDYLRKYQPTVKFVDELLNNRRIIMHLSSISNLELHSGQSIKRLSVRKKINEISAQCAILNVTFDIAGQAGNFKREYDMDVVDSILAATAILQDLILITKNRKHFQKIKGLKILSP